MTHIKSVFTVMLTPAFAVKTGVGGAVAFVLGLMGGWDAWLQCLCAFMVFDFAMGLYCARKGKSTKTESGKGSSEALIDGLFKKGAILAVVFICYQLEVASEFESIRNGIIIAFLIGEGTSIIENWGLLGWPMPEKFKDMLEVLKNKKE